jgi:hypothetical protein
VRHHQPLLSYGASAAGATPLFYAPLINTLVPTTAGSVTPTFTRTGLGQQATFVDWEGAIRVAQSGTARFVGTRIINTQVPTSEDWTNASWTKTIGTVTATTLTATGANQTVTGTVTGHTGSMPWVMRVRMSRITGTGNIQLTLDNSTWTTVTLTGSPQTFSIAQSVTNNPTFGIRIVTSGDAINADRIQVENVSGQSNQNPGEYVSIGVLAAPYQGSGRDGVQYFATKNGNTVASNIVTEATGAALNTANGASTLTNDANGPFGYFAEVATENRIIDSRDMTSGWTITGLVRTGGQTGPDGRPYGIQIKTTAATVGHFQYRVANAALTVITNSIFAKAGTVSWLGIGFDVDAKTDGAFFDLTNGVVGTVAAGATATISGPYLNGYYRCTATRTYASAAHYLAIEVHSVDNQTSTWTAAGTEYITVWGAQQEGLGYVTSYQDTTPGLAANRDAEVLTYVFAGNANATVGTAYAELRTLWSTAAAASVAVGFTVTANGPLYSATEAATVIRTNDGTNNVGKTGLASTATAVRKRAASWTGSTLSVTGDGASVATGTFDGNMGSTALAIGCATGGAGGWNGTIRNVKLFTTAENLVTLTT